MPSTRIDPLVSDALDRTGDSPLFTYIDAANGERTELTAAAFGSWVARTAGLLRDGCGLGAGDRLATLLPAHWQTAAVLLGAWSLGVQVSHRPWATAGLPAGPGQDEPVDAVFVSRKRIGGWLETVPEARHRFALGLEPGGAPMAEVPEGYLDFVAEIGRSRQDAPDYDMIRGGDAATPDGTSYRQWSDLARGVADARGITPGDRILVDVAVNEEPSLWLLAPMMAGASIVLAAGVTPGDLDSVVAAEGVTHVL
ncbi:TIGR03089 family protein [Phytomonospora sp. NPDC050363]|uniref:TIGR03089 family protein n=1 Tax=Phytomonospora sp. NPDC050363 TaxID=3155642 RepID=UPI003411465D